MTKVTDDERLIEKSGYFREKWYLRNYPEAAGSGSGAGQTLFAGRLEERVSPVHAV